MLASGNIPMSDDNFVSFIILVRYGGRGMDAAWSKVLCTVGNCRVAKGVASFVSAAAVVVSFDGLVKDDCLGDMKLGEPSGE
jgi:hypothetical protein